MMARSEVVSIRLLVQIVAIEKRSGVAVMMPAFLTHLFHHRRSKFTKLNKFKFLVSHNQIPLSLPQSYRSVI